METKWLEDFLSLAETSSFSRAAQLRHVTQPALSRRIQSLEAWAGIDLVDRSSFPTRLTPAGRTLREAAVEILGALQTARNLMRSQDAAGADTVEFAVPHTLAFTFFPQWLLELRSQFPGLRSRLIALNVHDAVLRMIEGGADLLVSYHHASQPLQLDAERYEMLSLGSETLAPYAQPDAEGRPRFTLPGVAVPFLAYGGGAYMAGLVERLLPSEGSSLDPVYETDMAEGLKAMALAGHGVAFLPASSVRDELRSHRLVRAAEAGRFELSMAIRIYRERPGLARRSKPAALALWRHLAGADGGSR